MPQEVITGLFAFDPTKSNPANFISKEKHAVYTPARDDFHFIIPRAAPFFATSLVVENDTTGEIYVEGEDYTVGHWFVEAINSTGRPIAGSIRFIKRDVAGIISVDYHTLGGQWGFDTAAILKELSQRATNPLTRGWAQIDTLPTTFPPIPHDQRVDTLIGFEEITSAITGIIAAIENSGEGVGSQHIADRDNPHEVTKAHVQLDSVANYPMATLVEAVSTLNTRYMSPYTTDRAIYEKAVLPFETHVNGGSNPHGTTAADVDTLTIDQINQLIAGRLATNGTAYDSSQLFGMDQTALYADILSGQATDSAQLEGRTFAQATAEILEGRSADSTLFDGKSALDWEMVINTIAEGQVVNAVTNSVLKQELDLSDAAYVDYTKIMVRQGAASTWLLTHTTSNGGVTTYQINIPVNGTAVTVQLLNSENVELELTVTLDPELNLWVKLLNGEGFITLLQLSGSADAVDFGDTSNLVTLATPQGTSSYSVPINGISVALYKTFDDALTALT